MSRSDDSQLDGMIAAMEAQAGTAARLGCPDAAQLIEMALLALRMRRYGISDAELNAFCGAIKQPKQVPPVSSTARQRAIKTRGASRRRSS